MDQPNIRLLLLGQWFPRALVLMTVGRWMRTRCSLIGRARFVRAVFWRLARIGVTCVVLVLAPRRANGIENDVLLPE